MVARPEFIRQSPFEPAARAYAVTPHATNYLPNGACLFLTVQGEGNLDVLEVGETEYQVIPVPAGIVPLQVLHVRSTGTTATGITAYY